MARQRRGRSLERERARRRGERPRRVGSAPDEEPRATGSPSRRAAAQTCGWCGGSIEVKPVGRIPTWCSASCRQRAWEQRRAAASGLAAVRVIERVVERRVEVPRTPAHGDWAPLLQELARQLDQGRVYPRDL